MIFVEPDRPHREHGGTRITIMEPHDSRRPWRFTLSRFVKEACLNQDWRRPDFILDIPMRIMEACCDMFPAFIKGFELNLAVM